jgi:hypothetical protein
MNEETLRSWVAYLLEDDEDEVPVPVVARSRYGRRLVPTVRLDPLPEPNNRRPVVALVQKSLQGGICIRWKRPGRQVPDDCPVCLEQKAVVRTQCGHTFCGGCILKVCFAKPVCPYCRGSIQGLQVVDRGLYDMWKMLGPALQPDVLRIV